MTKLNLSTNPQIALTQLRRFDFALQTDVDTSVNSIYQIDKYGWQSANPLETASWAYSSATQITVTGADATLYYQQGDKIKLVQGTSTYYLYITSVAASTLNVTGGSDYVITNVPITNYKISRMETPYGFPLTMNWSPTLTGFSVNPSSASYRFCIKGSWCCAFVSQLVAGTSNANTFTISAPVTSRTVTNGFWTVATTQTVDNSALLTVPGLAFINSASTNIILKKDVASTAWTAVNNKSANFTLWYEI